MNSIIQDIKDIRIDKSDLEDLGFVWKMRWNDKYINNSK